jgi:predicted dienelactone hydrolase
VPWFILFLASFPGTHMPINKATTVPNLTSPATLKATETQRSWSAGTKKNVSDSGFVQGRQPAKAAVPPTQKGPYEVQEISTTIQRNGRSIPVVAEVPKGLVGKAPTMLFVPGFMIDSKAYEQTTKYLASHGVVVLRVQPPGGIFDSNHEEMSLDVSAAVDWATSSTGPLSASVDGDHIGITGHSLGGKLAVMTAVRDPRIKALFAIDPVNAREPDIVKGGLQNLTIPIGLVGETTDSSRFLAPAAAPSKANFQTFFSGSLKASSVSEWTIAGADHFDFVDDGGGAMAALASNGGTAETADVLQATRSLLVAFVKQNLGGENMGRYLKDDLPQAVTLRERHR